MVGGWALAGVLLPGAILSNRNVIAEKDDDKRTHYSENGILETHLTPPSLRLCISLSRNVFLEVWPTAPVLLKHPG